MTRRCLCLVESGTRIGEKLNMRFLVDTKPEVVK